MSNLLKQDNLNNSHKYQGEISLNDSEFENDKELWRGQGFQYGMKDSILAITSSLKELILILKWEMKDITK